MIPKDQLISFRGPLGLKCGPHINSGLEVLVVTNGVIEILLGNERFFAEKGDAILILPYEVHAFAPQEDARGRVYMFSSTIVEELFKSREMSEIQSGKFKIPREMNALDTPVSTGYLFHNSPGIILGAVVHKNQLVGNRVFF